MKKGAGVESVNKGEKMTKQKFKNNNSTWFFIKNAGAIVLIAMCLIPLMLFAPFFIFVYSLFGSLADLVNPVAVPSPTKFKED